MIFTERTVRVNNDKSTINAPVILYRGDKNIEIRFELLESPYKYSNKGTVNIIETTDASYGQLVIKTPNDEPAIFSDIVETQQSHIIFTITYDMIDEIKELGTYDFQIRLFDANQTSKVSLPEITGGIIVKEPIASEDMTNNVTNSATVGNAIVTNDVGMPTFVGGKYNKTDWNNGDIISKQKLNKMEEGIYESYELGMYNSSQIKDKATKQEIDVERKRINNLTKMEEGSTTGDVELQDIRIGHNGTTYENAGEAVRQQIGELDDNSRYLKYDIKANYTETGYLNANGAIVSNYNFLCTDFIELPVNITKACISGLGVVMGSNLSIASFYDENKNIICSYLGDKGSDKHTYEYSDYEIPKNTKYVRFSIDKDTLLNGGGYGKITIKFLDSVTEQLNNYKKMLGIITPSINVGYINSSGIIATDNKQFRYSSPIECKSGETLYIYAKGVTGNVAIVSDYNGGQYGKPLLVATSDDYTLYTYKCDTDIQVVISFDYSDEYLIYKYDINDMNKELRNVITSLSDIDKDLGTKYYVGYGSDDGNEYFSSLVECLYKVQENGGKSIVNIAEGEYDILSELGGMDYINSKNTTDHNWVEVQPVVSDCKIVGHGKVILKFLLEETAYEHYWLFSALNIRGNVELENIEIHSANCRYSIHDESNGEYPNTTRRYTNVRCYQNIRNNTKYGTVGGQTIGCGYAERTTVYLENCYFTRGNGTEVWTCHASEGCQFIFNDTIFDCIKHNDNSGGVRISENNGNYLYATLTNCFLMNALKLCNETTNPNYIGRTDVKLINTKIPELINVYTTVESPVVSYNTITGAKEILLSPTTV